MSMVALMALSVVLILALGMLVIGNGVFLTGKRSAQSRGAIAMADAGVEYGYWQAAFNNVALPYTLNRTLGVGRFTVTVTDNSASIAQTYKIVSKGVLNNYTFTITRIIQTQAAASSSNIADYALCSQGNLASTSVNTTGDIRTNGNINFTTANASVTGNAMAGGTCSVAQITGTATASATAMTFPVLDTTYYQGIANRTFPGSVNWNGFTFLTANEVVYVNGDINWGSGTISGTGIIVSSGRFNFNGNLAYGLSTDRMAALSLNGANMNGGCSSLVGIYYCHNSFNNATVLLMPPLTVSRGSFAADTINFNSGSGPQMHINFDSGLTNTIARQLHIPGY